MSELDHYINSYFGITGLKGKQISALFEQHPVSKGHYVIKAGNQAGHLSFIQSGYFRVFRENDPKSITQYLAGPGDFIADLQSLVFLQPARMYVRALTPGILFTISSANYRKINEFVPEWTQLEKLFLAKCFMFLEDRIYAFLSMTAKERYTFLFERSPELFNAVPLQYIASMLGMSPETLSRIRSGNS